MFPERCDKNNIFIAGILPLVHTRIIVRTMLAEPKLNVVSNRIESRPLSPFFRLISRGLAIIPSALFLKTRVCHALLSLVPNPGNRVLEANDGLSFVVPNIRETIALEIFGNGLYETATVDALRRNLKPGDSFIDVGANIGAISLFIGSYLKNGTVWALECSPYVLPYLRENVQRNQASNVRVLECAAHHTDGVNLPFLIHKEASFGMGSLGQFPGIESTIVKGRTLDSLVEEKGIRNVRAIKIDVEGFEQGVLQGAERLLGRESPVVVYEFCDWAATRMPNAPLPQEYLESLGYKVWTLSDYFAGRPCLKKIMRTGYANLIATK